MELLGIGGSRHEFSFCLLQDGVVRRAVSEERLSREKLGLGTRSWRFKGLEYCTSDLGINIDNIDYIFADDLCDLKTMTLTNRDLVHRVVRVNHHMAHACSAFYASGMERSAIFVGDINGSLYDENQYTEVMSMGIADSSGVRLFDTQYSPLVNHHTNSLARLYLFATYQCGFSYGEYEKLMDLSYYGRDIYVKKLERVVDCEKRMFFSEEIAQVIIELLHSKSSGNDGFEKTADVAYAVQSVYESSIFRLLCDLYKKTSCENLCLSGSVAINQLMVSKITARTPFRRVYRFPDAGEDGTAVGAAFYGYYGLLHKGMLSPGRTSVVCGKAYGQADVENMLKKYASQFEIRRMAKDELLSATVAGLRMGKIIGWFQGASEFGSYSFGNRSVLANPHLPSMASRLAVALKGGDAFHPLTAAALIGKVGEFLCGGSYDDINCILHARVLARNSGLIPAVINKDGTVRYHLANQESNDMLYKLVNLFNQYTGIPMLINEPLCLYGAPIVETPKDAVQLFLASKLDALVIDRYYLTKR